MSKVAPVFVGHSWCCRAEDCSIISPAFRIAHRSSGRSPWAAFKWPVMAASMTIWKMVFVRRYCAGPFFCLYCLLPQKNSQSTSPAFLPPSLWIQIPPKRRRLMSTPRTSKGSGQWDRRRWLFTSATWVCRLSATRFFLFKQQTVSTWMERRNLT